MAANTSPSTHLEAIMCTLQSIIQKIPILMIEGNIQHVPLSASAKPTLSIPLSLPAETDADIKRLLSTCLISQEQQKKVGAKYLQGLAVIQQLYRDTINQCCRELQALAGPPLKSTVVDGMYTLYEAQYRRKRQTLIDNVEEIIAAMHGKAKL